MQPLVQKRCKFCKKATNNPLLGEKFIANDIVCHYYCLVLSNNINQNGADNEGILGFLPVDIRKELKESRKTRCSYCGKEGATIHCQQKHCKTKFHLPCGLAKGSSHEFHGNFPSYCGDHHRVQRLPMTLLKSADREVMCVVCLDDIHVRRERRSIVWATCCKRQTFLHRVCAQQYANNAGYDVKCPNCSSRIDFVNCLLKNGVFCPLREASWEQNGSFNDLFYSNMCCMRECQADSRDTDRLNSLWELISCSRCVAFNAHRACGGFQLLTDSFLCEPCQAALREELPPEPTDSKAKPCSVAECLNPNGRYAFSNQGDWRTIQCGHCPNFVAHFRCCDSKETWYCNSYQWASFESNRLNA
ncbi:PHD finger protein 7-like [Chrysoperla carnea]|uniref:PHD finger protein 7-like n=1 Tax=Chrysoperla carnea TaxID=189513 RepID=UPI001D074886|nr:PHD finger protein 7-like [Chrysoperla carnea]